MKKRICTILCVQLYLGLTLVAKLLGQPKLTMECNGLCFPALRLWDLHCRKIETYGVGNHIVRFIANLTTGNERTSLWSSMIILSQRVLNLRGIPSTYYSTPPFHGPKYVISSPTSRVSTQVVVAAGAAAAHCLAPSSHRCRRRRGRTWENDWTNDGGCSTSMLPSSKPT